MKEITIRDLRQRWPEAEAALNVEKEMLITRGGKPVAKLVKYEERPATRKRFDPKAHGEWQRKASGGHIVNWVEEGLLKERDER